jgi:hypothetical protein
VVASVVCQRHWRHNTPPPQKHKQTTVEFEGGRTILLPEISRLIQPCCILPAWNGARRMQPGKSLGPVQQHGELTEAVVGVATTGARRQVLRTLATIMNGVMLCWLGCAAVPADNAAALICDVYPDDNQPINQLNATMRTDTRSLKMNRMVCSSQNGRMTLMALILRSFCRTARHSTGRPHTDTAASS